ncbi:GCN5-like N-acetyltransferase [Vibrio ichthyoenteri ATCC 700023]|uniref:GCN5-like N-acetyltransferase n=1 Tax=Vibrio ichthyoenteri ATCC 700023 TaxID=870968 RepID=F9S4S7_9VIBR|nr:GNAT family N-acetyltransferase [Vibrio ichthyoenteri]EGU36476.1 GCN5-like N-acetyltransferase [Vibrio ichthyoenteri ATCC 700023]
MKLIPLAMEHAPTLLAFEQKNRGWFEQHITPREEDFYSLVGVQTHIAELLLDQTLNKAYSTLLLDRHNNLVGRVNLANIQQDKAFLGYRLGKAWVKKGLAKKGVKLMIEQAKVLKLKRLVALASVSNIASQKVLTSQGFKPYHRLASFTEVQGKALDCIEYRLDLS